MQTLLQFDTHERINIDLVSMTGVSWDHLDGRILNMHLLELGLTPAIMFDSKGNSVLASEALYKKSALIARGHFRPVSNFTVDFVSCGMKKFLEHHESSGLEESQVLFPCIFLCVVWWVRASWVRPPHPPPPRPHGTHGLV